MNHAWSAPGDAELDEDLLAPQGFGVSADDEPDDLSETDGQWEPAQGYPCTRRAVRIWVDPETRHLTRVRLSTRWRERVAGRKLDDSFTEAFFLANARIGGSPPGFSLEQATPAEDLELNWDNYRQLSERAAELMDQMEALDARDPSEVRWADLQGDRVSATSSNGHVTVTLGLSGLTEKVTLSERWLERARVREISDAVMSAHTRAYEQYRPPTFVPGEPEELAIELAQVQADLQHMMGRGFA